MKKNIKRILRTLIVSTFLCTSLTSTLTSYADTRAYNQDVTATTAPIDKKGAGGKLMTWTYVAVHPKTWGSHENPLVPFGTYIEILDEPIVHNLLGTTFVNLQVWDIGQVNNEDELSNYWIDVYWGPDETRYNTAAKDFGQKKRDLHIHN